MKLFAATRGKREFALPFGNFAIHASCSGKEPCYHHAVLQLCVATGRGMTAAGRADRDAQPQRPSITADWIHLVAITVVSPMQIWRARRDSNTRPPD